MSEEGKWLFAYGSLIWRPDFRFIKKQIATLSGWKRVFWQGSTDHRGVPGHPGRVVTLVREEACRCVGMAFQIGLEEFEQVISRLDFREKGGYDLKLVEIEYNGRKRSAYVYIATPGNPDYLGPAPPEDIADQILKSAGPSGRNDEYVMRLAQALRAIGADDLHVFEIDRLVRERLQKK